MIRLLCFCLLWAGPAAAFDLTLPATARQTVERATSPDTYQAPTDVYRAGEVPAIAVEGGVNRTAWRIDSAGLTPLQVMRPLRGQLEAAGFDILLDCASAVCGGFDFRFATETLPGPHMYVNIRDYHFVTAARGENSAITEVITVLTSASATSAYVQVIQADVFDAGNVQISPTGEGVVASPNAVDALEQQLLTNGHVVLSDLDFDVGTTDLGPGPFASLIWLASFLQNRPDQRVALVGHTDTVGGLDVNITLSRQRAASVRQRLIERYQVPEAQMDAEGMGYLSPAASNLTLEGREANRRVEVILLSL